MVVSTAAGSSVKLDDSGTIEIAASGSVKLVAGTVEIDAGTITLSAGLVRAPGLLQCDTLVTNSVVSASYTPGAGNVW